MRTKKAFYNMSASLMAQIIAIICGLITPRLILSNFGSTYNGVINSATQFLSMVSILRLGIAGATRVALYKTLASGDSIGTSRIMKATKQYMRKIAFVILLYAVLLMLIYPFISHNDLTKFDCALIIAIVSISTLGEYFFGISNVTLLTADQSEYISNIANIIAIISNTIITAILIKLHFSIFAVKLGSSVVYFITPLVLNIYVKKKYKLVSDCEPDTSALKQRNAVAFHSIANIIHSNTDIVLLTLFADAKEISVYTVYYMVISKLKSMLQVFTSGMEAAFGNMWYKKEMKTLNQVFRSFELMIFSFATIVFSCAGILILPFVELYTKSVTDVNYIRWEFAFLIVITEAIFCIRQPYLLLVQATGSYEETKKGAMLEAIVNLGSSIILVNLIGISGTIIGTLLANIIRTTQYILFTSKRLLNRSLKEVIKKGIVFIMAVVIIALLSSLITSSLQLDLSWFTWLVQAAIVFGVSIIVTTTICLVYYKNDTMYLFAKAKSLVYRRPNKKS